MQAIHEHENRVSLKPPYMHPFSLWIEVLMMWYWKLLKDLEHIISPRNPLFYINWFYYSWISKIVKWFCVWNFAHISCKCSVHGVISPSCYQGQKASNNFPLQTNNFLFFVVRVFQVTLRTLCNFHLEKCWWYLRLLPQVRMFMTRDKIFNYFASFQHISKTGAAKRKKCII